MVIRDIVLHLVPTDVWTMPEHKVQAKMMHPEPWIARTLPVGSG